jgi:hypothetical protein
MSSRLAIGLGAVLGLALGVLVSVTTDLPLAPEAGLALGALIGWRTSRGVSGNEGHPRDAPEGDPME